MKKPISKFSYIFSIVLGVGSIIYGVNIYLTKSLRAIGGVKFNLAEYAIYFSLLFIAFGIWVIYLVFKNQQKKN